MTEPADAFLVVGCGLIGSSLARAAKARGLAKRVLVLDADPATVETVKRLGVADVVATNAKDLGEKADLVALCTPVRAMGAAARAAAPALKPGAVVFDVGSVKEAVAEAVAAPIRAAGGVFVPAHPIAGTERSGPEAGFESLFEGRWCVLTPAEGGDAPPSSAVERVARFWTACGARTAVMGAGDHDAILAATSHVPHLIAYALTASASDGAGAPREDVVRYSAGGFRDFTRIAASDPVMWRDVFLTNRDAVLEALARVEAELAALRAAVEAGDGDELEARFKRTRAVREAIIEAGQETDAPNFGRQETRKG